MRELNPYVRIECVEQDLLEHSATTADNDEKLATFLRGFTCVVVTEMTKIEAVVRINSLCRANNVHFVLSDVYGLFGFSFTDFGDEFETHDLDGEEYRDMFVAKISSETEACIEVLDQHAHNLEVHSFFSSKYIGEFRRFSFLLKSNQKRKS